MGTPAETKRRGYGTGSVPQRADGLWIGRVDVGWTARGTRRRVTVSGATRRECEKALERKRGEIARDGAPTEGTAGRATVKSWAGQWLELRRNEIRPKTLIAYRSSVNAAIVPAIGHKRLGALTPGDVRAVALHIRKAGGSTTTALHAHRVLMHLLKDAVIEGHAVPQGVRLTSAPPKAINDRTSIPRAEALRILAEARKLPDRSRWVAALLQGMRQGEALGLTWGALDLTAGTLDVSWQLQSIPYLDRAAGTFRTHEGHESRHLHKTLHLVRPKTSSSHRIVPLVPWMIGELIQWREVAPPSAFGLVWPRVDGTPRLIKDDTEQWKSLQDAARVTHPAGRHYAGHEARHSTATLLLEEGIDPKVIQAVLGHSSAVTTRGYQHVSHALARDAMERLAARLELTAG